MVLRSTGQVFNIICAAEASTGQVINRRPSNGFVSCSSQNWDTDSGRKTTPLSSCQYYMPSRDLSLMMFIWFRWHLLSFCPVRSLLPPVLCFSEESHCALPALRSGGFGLHSGVAAVYTNYLGLFCKGDCLFSLFIYLYQCGLMDIYFILWVIFQ